MKIRCRNFTLVELLVVIMIIAVLAAILLPALKVAKDTAQRISCLSHVKAIGVGYLCYLETSDTWVPVRTPSQGGHASGNHCAKSSMEKIYEQIARDDGKNFWDSPQNKFLACPSWKGKLSQSRAVASCCPSCFGCYLPYGLNSLLLTGGSAPRRLSTAKYPSLLMVAGERFGAVNSYWGVINCMSFPTYSYLGNRHSPGNGNVVYYDGHAESVVTSNWSDPTAVLGPDNPKTGGYLWAVGGTMNEVTLLKNDVRRGRFWGYNGGADHLTK